MVTMRKNSFGAENLLYPTALLFSLYLLEYVITQPLWYSLYDTHG